MGTEPIGGTRWRKKPVTIDARQATGTPDSNREIIEWTRGSSTPAHMGDTEGDHQTLYISTLESEHRVTPGDWIIRGVAGEHYPCKPEIFAATYEATPVFEEKMAVVLDAIETSEPVGGELASSSDEPFPYAQSWRPHTAVEKAGMTAAASMNEAFWVLVSKILTNDDERLHSNFSLWRPAADFVIANRDAPAEAIAIHLARKKIGGTMTPEPVEITLWTVFKTVFLLVHDAIVEAAKQATPAPAEPAPSWPGDLAMQPQPGAFDATGYLTRR